MILLCRTLKRTEERLVTIQKKARKEAAVSRKKLYVKLHSRGINMTPVNNLQYEGSLLM